MKLGPAFLPLKLGHYPSLGSLITVILPAHLKTLAHVTRALQLADCLHLPMPHTRTVYACASLLASRLSSK